MKLAILLIPWADKWNLEVAVVMMICYCLNTYTCVRTKFEKPLIVTANLAGVDNCSAGMDYQLPPIVTGLLLRPKK